VATEFTADPFIDRLEELRPPGRPAPDDQAADSGATDIFIGVRMGAVFALAKDQMNMAPEEIETLLESPIHEARVGAVSVMDWQARSRKTSKERRRALFDLYIRRHDRINTWDLVDRSAIYVVGEYLRDKPRDVRYTLARSDRSMERRTAIVSCYAFIRHGDLDDTFRIAELLLHDDHDLVHKAVGWMLREAGKKDETRLRAFLDAHATSMPRVMLRYATEKLDKPSRDRNLASKRADRG
jgi:3-methyladenine DNA glycosylase AlkD